MWYFVWIIGVTMAVTLSVMHALWFELQEEQVKIDHLTLTTMSRPPSKHDWK
jgi:cyd operon protein YbgT